MRLTVTLITGFSLLLAIPVAGQDNPPAVVQSQTQGLKPFGTVQSGNTTIVFAPADSRDIDTVRLRTWEDFAETHTGIARALAGGDSREFYGHSPTSRRIGTSIGEHPLHQAAVLLELLLRFRSSNETKPVLFLGLPKLT